MIGVPKDVAGGGYSHGSNIVNKPPTAQLPINGYTAIKYDVDSSKIPNDRFKCTHYECPWSEYSKGTDWGFYLENGRNISGCQQCMERCEADENCQSIECGPDQPFMDGSIRAAHCSWWSKDACYKAEDFTLNPQNFILTCRQKEGCQDNSPKCKWLATKRGCRKSKLVRSRCQKSCDLCQWATWSQRGSRREKGLFDSSFFKMDYT